MKKLVVVGLIAFGGAAQADEVIEQPRNIVGVDAALVVPVGDYGEAANLGGGALVRLEFPVSTGGYVFGRTGIIFHTLKVGDSGTLTFVPLYVGYRHPLGTGGAYVAGEIGITLGYASVDTSLGRMSDSDSELGAMFSAGMRRGKLDLRGGLFLPDTDDAMGLMASAGFDFAGF
jgi:hypothetical protein